VGGQHGDRQIERPLPEEALRQRGPERVQVGLDADGVVEEPLRRHVGRAADHHVRLRSGLAGHLVAPRDPEVQQLDLAEPAHPDVRRLDVAVGEPQRTAPRAERGRPRRVQGRRHPADDLDQRAGRQRGVAAQTALEVVTLDVLGDQRHPTLEHDQVEHPEDRRVLQPREVSPLVAEALAPRRRRGRGPGGAP
jgi:hypothetical protein